MVFRAEITVNPPVLVYHEIVTGASVYRYSTTAQRFVEHLLTLQQFVRAKGLTSSEPQVNVTFDDGHISQFENALPHLERFGQRAIYFITTGWTDKRAGYMGWNHLRELERRGHEIQSHGWSHAFLTHCSPKELENELLRSKTQIEDRLGSRVDAVSMPGGRWNRDVLDACIKAGYLRVFTSDPWGTSVNNNRAAIIGRWMVTRNMNEQSIASIIDGKGLALRFLRARHLATATARVVLGDPLYQSLWRALSNKNQSLEADQESSCPQTNRST